MSFQAILNCSLISSKKFHLLRLYTSLYSANLISTRSKFQKKNFLPSFDFFVKSFIFLLCFSLLQFSIYHVVCLELAGKQITKSHLQLHECDYPQSYNIVVEPSYYEHDSNHSLHVESTAITVDNSSYANCIDEHIQYVKLSSETDVIHMPPVPVHGPVFHVVPSLALLFSNIPHVMSLQRHISKPSYVDSVIRTTVLLIWSLNKNPVKSWQS